ncbi:hypothetical protein ACHAWC_010577 [Mediolabrus comicus]
MMKMRLDDEGPKKKKGKKKKKNGGHDDDTHTDNNSDDLGLRRRKGGQNEQNEKEGGGGGGTEGMIPLSPIRTIEESPTRSSRASTSGGESSPSSPMRKIHSCLELKRQSTSKIGSISSSVRGGGGAEKSWIQRTYSSNSLPVTAEEEDSDDDDRTGCSTWQSIVKDDLGMEGSMLLTTLARLKEARVQASSYGGGDDVTNNSEESNDVDDGDDDMNILPNLSSLSNPWDEEEGEEKAAKQENRKNSSGSSFHITASFTKKRGKRKPWGEDNSSSLKTLLSGIVKRNHLSIENHLIQDAQSIAERGQHSLRKETRDAIDRYSEEVERCIDWIAHGPVYLGPSGSGGEDDEGDDHGGSERRGNTPKDVMEKQREELARRYTLVKRMKQNVGHTALMLSGGGAQTMYHLGSIKALVEAGIYEHIHVISGTSGGSISAAMCAIKTPAELLRDICVRTVASDYMLTGEQKKKNIRWFPKAFDMGAHFIKHGLVCDAAEFKRTCDFYYKDITFEEAYEMTGKHVCITVTASRASSGKGMQRLLLNHISTPNVTLASAVRASCALPGVFAPASLMIKDSRGKEVPFEVDGVEWIDGSVQADIPVKRISTLFNVSNYVVCQTNFHVAPFIHKSHHPSINSLYWKAFQYFMNDAGHRLATLVGLNILSHPSETDMDIYLQGGQESVWPYTRSLQEMLHLERSIEKCLHDLGERLNSVTSGLDLNNMSNDDVDSVSSFVGVSYRARLPGLGREAELLREKVHDLEQENEQLKKKVQRLQRALGISYPKSSLEMIVSVDEGELQ